MRRARRLLAALYALPGDGLGGRADLLPRGRIEAGRPGLGGADVRHQLVPDLDRSVVLRRCRSGRRCSSTCGRWRSRSSSTSCGRSCCSACCACSGSPPADRRGHHGSAPSPRSSGWRSCSSRRSIPSRAYYGTDTRASGLLLGAALALVWKPGHQFRRDAEVKPVGVDLARPRRPGRRGRVLRVVRGRPTRSCSAAGSSSCRWPHAWRSPPPSTPAPPRSAARPAVHDVGRQAVVLAVPVALADLRVHAAGDRHPADPVPDVRAAPRPHRGGGRAELPLRRGARSATAPSVAGASV